MFCNANGLCVGNTYFAHKSIHKKTWWSPDGSVSNEIDYICISKRWRSSLRDVKVRRGADVGSDHHLLVSEIKLKFKKIQKPAIAKPLDVDKLKDCNKRKEFEIVLNNKLELLAVR
jgi:hypothetical protein